MTNFSLKTILNIPHIIFDDGRVREATEVELYLIEYIKEIYEKKHISRFPEKIKNDRRKTSSNSI